VKVDFSDKGPVVCDPRGSFLPDQPPEATHESAFSEDQERVEAAPGSTVAGIARSTTTGGAPATDTVVAWVTLVPPDPVHWISYSVV
jgi:hypothetical protein